jgi:hypothetical protein
MQPAVVYACAVSDDLLQKPALEKVFNKSGKKWSIVGESGYFLFILAFY